MRTNLLTVLIALVSVACSERDDPRASGGSGGVAGTAGAGGWAASGGSSGNAGSGGSSGGAAGASGDWGAAPNWVPLNQKAAGCELEELVNAKEVRLLRWELCGFEPKCEQAVFNPALIAKDGAFSPNSIATDDATTTILALKLSLPLALAAFSDHGGMAVASFRTSTGNCNIWATSAWKKRIAVRVSEFDSSLYGGVLRSMDSSTPTAVFSIPQDQSGAPSPHVLGDSRWLWRWAPFDRLSSVSALDGSGFTIFAKAEGETLGLTGVTTTGPSFVYWEDFTPDGLIVQGRLMQSDGVAPPTVYLAPTDPDVSFGAPAFAHSHIGFMRGFKRSSVNKFENVELWASPFSEQPAALKPIKIADLASTSISTAKAGGHGKYATPAFAPPFGAQELLVFDLATGATTSFVVPPERVVKALLGLTRDHLYVAASKPGQGPSPYLMRFALP